MSKKFKVKAVFLLALVCVCLIFSSMPQKKLEAESEKATVSVCYSLLSLGYSDSQDKNSLVIEEYVGVELKLQNFNAEDKLLIQNNAYGEVKNYKTKLDNSLALFNLNSVIVVNEPKIDGNYTYVKIRYLNLPAYYVFNDRPVLDNNSQTSSKAYDILEKGLFYNKHYIVLNNPFGNSGKQKSLNLFAQYYQNVITNIKTYTNEINKEYIFGYSASDDRLYGDYKTKYNITGVNNNIVNVYEFVFKDSLPQSVSLYFLTFNQYMWYIVAIDLTLVVIGVLYLVSFIKERNKKEKDNSTTLVESEIVNE